VTIIGKAEIADLAAPESLHAGQIQVFEG
jgi:hypothetical protein